MGFGDCLARLNPEGHRWDRFGVFRTRAEANALCSLSVMGGETDFMTRLPDTAIGRCALASLRNL